MDPYDPEWRKSFFRAAEYHNRRLRKVRRLRNQLLRDYAGSYYTEGLGIGTDRNRRVQPLPYMKQAAEAHMLALAGGEIRFHITASKVGLVPFAKHFQSALNNLAKEIRLSDTVRDLVLDGFFGLAIAKIFLADAPMVEIEQDVWMDPGQPFVGRVDFNDFLFDTDATDFRLASFAGDRYRVPFYLLEEEDHRFDPEVVAQLHPTSRRAIDSDSEEARAIAFGEDTDEGEWENHIELCDVFFPRDQIICTWAVDGRWGFQDTDPLSVLEWDGGETGCYELLNLGQVPNNIIPSSPAENSKFIFDMLNSAWRRINAQSKRQKDILAVAAGEEQYVKNIINAPDGEAVTVGNVEDIKPLSLGGVNAGNFQFAMSAQQVADRMAGNLQARLGLGPSSETATQDRLIHSQVSSVEKSMQERVVRFVSRLGEHLARLLFEDPAKTIPGRVRVEGSDYEYDSAWTPEFREGSYDDYSYRVEPYSLPYKSPMERAQTLMGLVREMTPHLQFMAPQRIQFDYKRYFERIAELTDSPEILEMYKEGPPTGEPTSNHDATQSPVTRRETVRYGAGGGGQQPQQMAQAAMTSQPQGFQER